MFGKIPVIAEDHKRLRCTHEIKRRGERICCGRLAKAYNVSKYGNDFGRLDLCNHHANEFSGSGYDAAK